MQSKKHDIYILICLILLSIISTARLSDNTYYWIIDIFSHFPLQYALIASALLFYCLWRKAVRLAVFAIMIIVFNLSVLITPAGTVQASSSSATGTFGLYSANLHISNDDISGLTEELQDMDPDMVLLLEVTPLHESQLGTAVKKYPYSIHKTFSGEREIGFVFLSKFPILSSSITRLSDVCNFILKAKVEIGNKPVLFYGLHARRPDMLGFTERRDQFLSIAADIRNRQLPVILAGDFNSTPFAPIFRRLITVSGLRDPAADFGWQPSWPTYVPFLWIPIDHVLLSPEVRIHKRGTGSFIGSDHYPVFAELSIQN